jgi:hypothetical protein
MKAVEYKELLGRYGVYESPNNPLETQQKRVISDTLHLLSKLKAAGGYWFKQTEIFDSPGANSEFKTNVSKVKHSKAVSLPVKVATELGLPEQCNSVSVGQIQWWNRSKIVTAVLTPWSCGINEYYIRPLIEGEQSSHSPSNNQHDVTISDVPLSVNADPAALHRYAEHMIAVFSAIKLEPRDFYMPYEDVGARQNVAGLPPEGTWTDPGPFGYLQ